VAHRNALVVCLSLLLSVGPVVASEGPEIDWGSRLGPALKEAATSGKPVMVDVWAIWCVPCKEMDETTYRDPAIVEQAGEFIPVKIDHDLQELFVERYEVEALPLVLFLDSEGREISRLFGLLTTADLLALMNVVREGYPGYLESIDRTKEPAAAENVAAYLLAAGNPQGTIDVTKKALKKLKGEPPATRNPLELLQAEAWLAAGQLKPALTAFERLLAEVGDPESTGRALEGLAMAQIQKDGEAAASGTLERLRHEFPDRAARVAAAITAP
jgi:thioredoxin-like negative regulator of GroEL